MNFVSLFTKKEHIVGLEISDAYMRMALLDTKKKKGLKKSEIVFLKEEPLTPGIIVDGIIQNKKIFSSVLKKFLNESPVKLKFGVISLPQNRIYSHIFTFPKTVEGRRLEETMKLTIDFQLPIKSTDVYLDWEKLESDEESRVLLAAIPRSIVDDYLETANSIKFGIIAIESHPISFSRVIDIPKNETVISIYEYESGTDISIIHNRIVEFSIYLPKKYLENNPIAEEIRKIKDFYESKGNKIDRIINLTETKISGRLGRDAKLQPESGKWSVSIGAALRGLLPKADDNLVSMMPLGTEEAYEYHKAIVFSSLLGDMAIGLSVFFSAAFIGAWFLILILQQNLIVPSSKSSGTLALPADTVSIENRAANFNSLIAATGQIVANSTRWSVVLEEIHTKLVPGIAINTASLDLPALSISGVAKNRNQLNLFKQSLESSSLFINVVLPLTNLNQKDNIPFSISFKLKDPNSIGYANAQ